MLPRPNATVPYMVVDIVISMSVGTMALLPARTITPCEAKSKIISWLKTKFSLFNHIQNRTEKSLSPIARLSNKLQILKIYDNLKFA